MTVDKFGHYIMRKYKTNNSEEKRNYCMRMFGFTLDGNEINMVNKRITNVALPLDELDAVNKAYVSSEIYLLNGTLNEEIQVLRNEVKELKDQIYKLFAHLHQ